EPAHSPSDSLALRKSRACSAREAQANPTSTSLSAADPPDGQQIANVEIQGTQPILARMVAAMLKTRAGTPFDSRAAGADLVALHALDAFDDVRLLAEARPEGLALTVVVHERPVIREVFFSDGSNVPVPGIWIAPLAGDLYVPASLTRATRAL